MVIVLLIPFARFAAPDAAAASVSDAIEPSAPAASLFNVVIPEPSWWALPLTMALWATWCLVYVSRTAGALVALRRTKRNCRPFPAKRASRLRRWTELHTGGRRARLVLSNDVSGASVLGLTSPAIAVSPPVLHELSDEELDSILVHEWAHVQRRDDWARLAQLMVRALAGFH